MQCVPSGCLTQTEVGTGQFYINRQKSVYCRKMLQYEQVVTKPGTKQVALESVLRSPLSQHQHVQSTGRICCSHNTDTPWQQHSGSDGNGWKLSCKKMSGNVKLPTKASTENEQCGYPVNPLHRQAAIVKGSKASAKLSLAASSRLWKTYVLARKAPQ